jgi:hypothetical protein
LIPNHKRFCFADAWHTFKNDFTHLH